MPPVTGFSVTGQQIGPKERDNEDAWRKLLERQRERENVSRAEGEQQFRAQIALAKQRGAFTTETPVGQRLLDHVLTDALEPLENAIAGWQRAQQEQVKRPGPGKRRQGAQVIRVWLANIGPRHT